MGGTKYDQAKVRVELLPTAALEQVARVLGDGAGKYGDWNWAQGMRWTRLYGAILRHVFAWGRREDKDPETKLSHLAHAACGILFLLQYELSALGEDDRIKIRKENN